MDSIFKKLGSRENTFRMIYKHMSRYTSGTIIETGTARTKDNWRGDGQSTLIWDLFLQDNIKDEARPEWKCVSIDIDKKNIDVARGQTSHIEYRCGDSVKVLSRLSLSYVTNCRLLYLDSFDWTPALNFESSFHHLCELATIWRLLPSGCLIVVDDRHDPNNGKHWMVQRFMDKAGIEPAFCDYQVGWVKVENE